MLALLSLINISDEHTQQSLIGQSVVHSVHLGVLVNLSIAKSTMPPPLNIHLDSQSLATGDLASHSALRWTISPPTDGLIVTSNSVEG